MEEGIIYTSSRRRTADVIYALRIIRKNNNSPAVHVIPVVWVSPVFTASSCGWWPWRKHKKHL